MKLEKPSSVRPRVDGKGEKLREPATDSSDSREEAHRSDEVQFFSARSDFRSSQRSSAWSEKQLIAAAKSGRTLPSESFANVI